jgi:hypothetical protein
MTFVTAQADRTKLDQTFVFHEHKHFLGRRGQASSAQRDLAKSWNAVAMGFVR